MASWVNSHRLAAFLAATFVISWIGGFVWMLFVADWAQATGPFARAYLPNVVVVLGPALGAGLVARLSGGGAEVASLLGRLRPTGQHWRWYLGMPLVSVAATSVAFAMAGVSAPILLLAVAGSGGFWLAAHFTIQIVVVGAGEELGWRGWLLPHLMRKRGIGRATVLTILVWELWHAPKLLGGGPEAAILVVQLAAVGILLSWLWLQLDGDVFALAVAHASVNAPIFFVATRIEFAPGQLIAGWGYLTLLYVAAAVAAVGARGVWRKPVPSGMDSPRETSVR